MSSQETMNLVRQLLTFGFAYLAGRGILTADQSTALVGDIVSAILPIAGAASIASSVWAHRGMKKVPVASTAVALPGGAPVGAVVSVSGTAAKVVGALLIGFFVLHAAPASAATKAAKPATNSAGIPCDPLSLIPGCTPTAVSQALTTDTANLQTIWNEIVSATQADLTYAKALADNVDSPGSKLRSTCYAALITANAQANGMTLKNADGSPMVAPNPAAISKFEQAAELIDNLQPTAPVMSACAAAANAVAQSTTQFLTTILSTVAVKAAVPVLP